MGFVALRSFAFQGRDDRGQGKESQAWWIVDVCLEGEDTFCAESESDRAFQSSCGRELGACCVMERDHRR